MIYILMVFIFFGLTIISAVMTGCYVTDLDRQLTLYKDDDIGYPNHRPAAISGIITIALAVMTYYMIFNLLRLALSTGAI